MTPFLAQALLLIQLLWPVQAHIITQYQIVNTPLYGVTAYADCDGKAIVIDEQQLDATYEDRRLRLLWAASILVHESVHQREGCIASEYGALDTQLLFLESAHAPGFMTRYVRGLRDAAKRVQGRDQGER